MTDPTPNPASSPQQPAGGAIIPAPVSPAATPAAASAPTLPAAPAPTAPPKRRLTYKLRDERLEKVKEMMDKGVLNQTQIAKFLGVTAATVCKDMQEINKRRKTALTKESASNHVSTMLGQMEDIVKNATMDYVAISGNDPKSNAAKATLLQTSLRAVMAKAQLLMQTGVVPQDITALDKALEAQAVENQARQAFDPKLAEVVSNADSRRKVIDIVDKLKGISPDVAATVMDRLDSKIAEDEAKEVPSVPVADPPAPEPPAPTPQAGQ